MRGQARLGGARGGGRLGRRHEDGVADLLPDTAVTDSSQIIGKRLGSNVIAGKSSASGAPRCPTPNWRCLRAWPPSACRRGPLQAVVVRWSRVWKWTCHAYRVHDQAGGRRSGAGHERCTSESGATAEWVTLAVELSGCRRSWRRRRTWNFISRCRLWVARHRTVRREGFAIRRPRAGGSRAVGFGGGVFEASAAETPPASGQPAAPENGAMGEGRTYDEAQALLICGHGESLPMAEDGATSLSSVLEELAVVVCAEAVSARRASARSISISCGCRAVKGRVSISRRLAKRDSPQTAVYLVTADRTGSVASREPGRRAGRHRVPAELSIC